MFFGGVIIGFYSEQIKVYWVGLGKYKQGLFKWLTVGTFLFTLSLCVFSVFYFPKVAYQLPNSEYWLHKNKVLNWYFDKQTMGLGRLLLSPVWHLSFLFIFLKFQKSITKYLGWLLFSFGKNSLYAYLFHAFVIYPIPFLMTTYNLGGIVINSLVTGLSVLLVYVFMHLTASAFKGKI